MHSPLLRHLSWSQDPYNWREARLCNTSHRLFFYVGKTTLLVSGSCVGRSVHSTLSKIFVVPADLLLQLIDCLLVLTA